MFRCFMYEFYLIRKKNTCNIYKKKLNKDKLLN